MTQPSTYKLCTHELTLQRQLDKISPDQTGVPARPDWDNFNDYLSYRSKTLGGIFQFLFYTFVAIKFTLAKSTC